MIDSPVRSTPWGHEELAPLESTSGVAPPASWPCVVTAETVDRVFLPGATESLPDLGLVETATGPRRLWELPAPMVETESGELVDEGVTLTLRHRGGPSTNQRVSLRGLPRLPRHVSETDDTRSGEWSWQAAAEDVELIIDTHVEAVGDLASRSPPTDSLTWREGRERRGVRSLTDTLEAWRAAGRGDVPRYALIVRLASELQQVLPDVCKRPRVVLARDRQLRPVHRIEQVDSACLRWLARQPGWTVMEKAGPRQQVMTVVRLERADTLENRVVRDLLLRACRAADLYLRQHRRFGNHARVELVRAFTFSMRRLLRDSPVGSVSPLVGVPVPNYVLLHDARYRLLWDAYLRLVRHQTLLDSAWRWQRRVWSETCQLAVLAAVEELTPDPFTFRSDVAVSPEHSAGRFLDPTSAVSPFSLRAGTSVDVLLSSVEAAKHPEAAVRACAALAPDMVLFRRARGELGQAVCVWAALLPTHALPELPRGVRGVVVAPRLAAPGLAKPAGRRGVSWVELPLPIQSSLATLSDVLSLLLGLGA